MGQDSRIEWTDATWNPWQGCTKVSPACANCYMFSDLKRYGRDGSIVVRSKPPTFNLPLKRRRTGEYAIPPGSKVFTCSWSDWFHERADAWREDAWAIIRQRSDVTFQIVTKRTDRILDCLPADWGAGYANVWLIATVENQRYANTRIPELVKVPAAVHGLSIEPLLGPIDLVPAMIRALGAVWPPSPDGFVATAEHGPIHVDDLQSWIDWVIVGGESGHQARPMHPNWVRSLRDQCLQSRQIIDGKRHGGIAFHFKQWGEYCPIIGEQKGGRWDGAEFSQSDASDDLPERDYTGWEFPDGQITMRIGKKHAGRLLDGRTWDEFPRAGAAV